MWALGLALVNVIITSLNDSERLLNKNGCALYLENQMHLLVGKQSEPPFYMQFKLFHAAHRNKHRHSKNRT